MSEKYENLLNMALSTEESLRERTRDLNVGYEPVSHTWEVIAKYSREPVFPTETGIVVESLIAGYGILTVPQESMHSLADSPEIEFVEKPKSYLLSDGMPGQEACIATALAAAPYYSGRGVLLAVLDSGIDVRRPEFRKEDGSTRVVAYIDYGAPKTVYYSETQINEALRGEAPMPPFSDTLHGTAVAGIAGGYSASYRGVASGCDMMAVRLGSKDFLQTTDIMRGVKEAVLLARQRKQPLVINLSFGNTYGSHRGDGLLERFLDNAGELGGCVIVAGSGNEGAGFGHYRGEGQAFSVPFAIGPYENTVSLQIWKPFSERQFTITAPNGERIVLTKHPLEQTRRIQVGKDICLVYAGTPKPYSVLQELYVVWIAGGEYLTTGTWIVQGSGDCDLYVKGREGGLADTRFLVADPEGTITIPATARRLISVGAYDTRTGAYASFSGRGFAGSEKPDVVAPGVNVLAPWGEWGYLPMTGTSFATPIVSGMAAVLMEYGIVEGNDPYLYGEKLKALLRATAQPVAGEGTLPNEKTGFGAVCLADCFALLKKYEK